MTIVVMISLNAEKDCVHLANLHKVKGLEAPVVILAGASDSRIPPSVRMEHGDDGSEGYLFSLIDSSIDSSWGVAYFRTSDYAEEKKAEERAIEEEGKRLVYVAATRARNVLILCNRSAIKWGKVIPDSKWNPIMEPGLPDFFESVPPAEKEQAVSASYADVEELYHEAQEKSVLNDRSMEETTFCVENPSRLTVISKLAEDPEQTDIITLEAEERESTHETGLVPAESQDEGSMSTGTGHYFPALIGTMTHKLMEAMVTSGNQLDVEQAITEIIREYRTPHSEAYEEQFRSELLKVAQTMRTGGYPQTNGLQQDLLGTLLSTEEVYCEVPFCYVDEADDEKTVWNGVMDVVY